MARKKAVQMIEQQRQNETRQVATALASMLTQGSILDDLIKGRSQEDIAADYGISVHEVREIVNNIFANQTEQHAAMRARIGMVSIMRYEYLLQKIMPYIEGTWVTEALGDNEVREYVPPDPRFTKLAIDIIERENNIFKDERAIQMKMEGTETKNGYQDVDETIVTGDELFRAASILMSASGYVPADYADLTSADVLERMQMKDVDEMGNKLEEMTDAQILEELKRRKLDRDDADTGHSNEEVG